MQFDLGCVFAAAFPHFGTDEHGIASSLKRVLDTGVFRAIELAAVRDCSERKDVKYLLRSTNTKCVFLGGMAIIDEGLNLSSLDEGARTHAVERLAQLMDDAEDLGAVIFLISSGPDPGEPLRAVALSQLEKSVSTLCQHAREVASDQPMTVTLEHYDRNVHRRFLLGPSAMTAEFARAIRANNPNFGVTLDQSHLAQLREVPADALDVLGDAVCHVHLANCLIRDERSPLYGDLHPPFSIEGGEVGADEIMGFLCALKQSGYFERVMPYGRPIVSVEVRNPDGADPYLTLRQAIEAVMNGHGGMRCEQEGSCHPHGSSDRRPDQEHLCSVCARTRYRQHSRR